MYLSIFLSCLGFVIFFLWYLAADSAATRRVAGLGAIIASLLTCGLALWPVHGKTPITLGLDLRGGIEFLVEVQGKPSPQALDQASAVIRKRLDDLGTKEISIQPESDDRLKIQIPGLLTAEIPEVRKVITQAAKLEFRMVPLDETEIMQTARANGGKLTYQYA